jgi:hypothetical protein
VTVKIGLVEETIPSNLQPDGCLGLRPGEILKEKKIDRRRTPGMEADFTGSQILQPNVVTEEKQKENNNNNNNNNNNKKIKIRYAM